jgi:hypothetical protein
MRTAWFLLGTWILGTVVLFAQQTELEQRVLEDSLRAFGREEYALAGRFLAKYSLAHSNQVATLAFYLGECRYQTGDISGARKYLIQAFGTKFNRDEAASRLITIYEESGESTASETYRAYWERRLKDSTNSLPDSKWENVQPKGPRDLEEPMIIVDSRFPGGPGIEYSRGCYRLGVSRPSVAVFHLERGLVVNVPLQERFDSNNALLYYSKLAKAYRKKAELFKSNKFLNQEEFQAGVRRYVAEHRALEIPEAEQLAEHYRLKAIVVEARLVAKKAKKEQQKKAQPNAHCSAQVSDRAAMPTEGLRGH